MRYVDLWSVVAIGMCLAVGVGCASPQQVADGTRQRAEYVERYDASATEVERAVRAGLSEAGFEVLNTLQSEEGDDRVVRAQKGSPGDEDTVAAQIVVEPNADGPTTIYIDTMTSDGRTVDSASIVEGIRSALGGESAVAAAQPSGGTGSDETDAGGEEGGDESSGGDESASAFVEAVPQSSAYALVIGIESYRDLPPPTGAASDARRVAELLRDSFGLPGDHIRTLVDDRATRTDLESAIDWIAETVPDGGRIYFYYAGHGTPHPKKGTSLILPYEASQQTLTRTGLALDDVLAKLESSGAKSVVAFVDACFSGEGSRSVTTEGQRPTVPVELVDDQTKEGRTVLYAASKADQISGAGADGKGGLFTEHLVDALGTGSADVDGDGQITVEELDTYVTPRVARKAEELSRKQEPDLKLGPGGNDGADLSITWGLPVD